MDNNIFTNMLIIKRQKEYMKAKSREEKTNIIDSLVKDTGRDRKSIIRSLNNNRFGKKEKHKKRGRKKKYSVQVERIIKKVWEANDRICAERFYSQINVTLKDLKKYGNLEGCREENILLVQQVSLGTLKRIVAKFPKIQRKKSYYSGHSNPSRKIPIRTYFSSKEPYGFFGVDFVDHNGGDASGKFARTLMFTDPKETWIVRSACLGKDKSAANEAFELNMSKIPYDIKGLHSDNEPNLLASLLSAKAEDNNIFISRSRSYKKEDNGHTEQKNGDKVRALVGYWRYDTKEQIEILNKIYEVDDLLQNHFIASMRLERKEFNTLGKTVKRIYPEAKTPYQRVMEDKNIDIHYKVSLAQLHSQLNRLELIEKRDRLLLKLTKVG